MDWLDDVGCVVLVGCRALVLFFYTDMLLVLQCGLLYVLCLVL